MSTILEHQPKRLGIPHEAPLIALAEAVFRGDADALAHARKSLTKALDLQATADAIAIASGFNGITKIANATGLPLDQSTDESSTALRADTGIDRYSDSVKSARFNDDVRNPTSP